MPRKYEARWRSSSSRGQATVAAHLEENKIQSPQSFLHPQLHDGEVAHAVNPGSAANTHGGRRICVASHGKWHAQVAATVEVGFRLQSKYYTSSSVPPRDFLPGITPGAPTREPSILRLY